MKVRKLYKARVIEFYGANVSTHLKLPYVLNGISAGFPSPADDFLDINIDLNKHLIKNPSTTFYGRVKGDSMKDAGIHDGDLLIIDKSLEPTNNKIAVCFIDGEFTANTAFPLRGGRHVGFPKGRDRQYRPQSLPRFIIGECLVIGCSYFLFKDFKN